MPQPADLEGACCTATITRVHALRIDEKCPACGAHYWPHGPTSDAPRVSGVEYRDAKPANDTRPRVVDEPELIAVRGLLCALRPDPSGPFGWGPSDTAPRAPPLRAPVLVQCSLAAPSVPRGCFQPTITLASTEVHRVIDRILSADPRAGVCLAWLQRNGTLAEGLGPLYRAAAEALAKAKQADRWCTATAAQSSEGKRLFGRREVAHAHRAWFGSDLPGTP